MVKTCRGGGVSGGGGVERTVDGQACAASAPDAGCLLSPGERVVFRECWAGLSVLLGKLQGDDAMEQRRRGGGGGGGGGELP